MRGLVNPNVEDTEFWATFTRVDITSSIVCGALSVCVSVKPERRLDSLVTAREALEALQKSLGHIKQASRAAEATTLTWEEKGKPQVKVKRDALPAGIRRKISGLAARVETLMVEVKAIPVTKDQAAVAKAEKAKRKAKK